MNKNLPKPVFFRFQDLAAGQEATFKRTVTFEDLQRFAKITDDYNPLHFDDEYARMAGFDGCILPGLLTASFLSRLIGMMIPGRQALYLSQEMKFIKPVFIGDTLIVKGTIMKKEVKKRNKNIVVLKTEIINQNGIMVFTGLARVMVRNEH